MNIENIIREYLHNLESGNYQGITDLFSNNAIVISPLYGEKLVNDFYKELFNDTSQSKITLKNILISTNQENIAAAHFLYEWIMKNDSISPFECVDIFEFNANKKITKLTIIYDTYQTRIRFEKLKN